MATGSKKTTTKPTSSPTSAKWPFAEKGVAATASKVKPAAQPKKTAAVSPKKTEPAATKKVSAAKTEKPVSQTATATSSSPKRVVKIKTVTPEERYHMISTAAYHLAEKRGFIGGNEMHDWATAEAQIDAMINA